MKDEKIKLTILLYGLIGIFILIVGLMSIPNFKGYVNFYFIMISGALLLLMGGALVVMTLKQKVEGKLKKFLILTGVFASGYIIFVVLHNLFYALAEITHHITLLNFLMNAFEVIFFLAAIFVCPVGFIIGSIVSIALLRAERKKKKEEGVENITEKS